MTTPSLEDRLANPIPDIPVVLDHTLLSGGHDFFNTKENGVYIIGLFEDDKDLDSLNPELNVHSNRTLKALKESMKKYGGAKKLGKEGAARLLDANGRMYAVVGLGKKKFWNEPNGHSPHYPLEVLRNAVGAGIQEVEKLGVPKTIALDMMLDSTRTRFSNDQLVETITYAAASSGYQGTRTLSPFRKNDSHLKEIRFLAPEEESYKAAFKSAADIVATESNVRLLLEASSNIITPYKLVDAITKVAGRYDSLKVEEVVKKEELMEHQQDHPYAGLAAVARGSKEAALVRVSYRGDTRTKKKIAVIGKGITFDTGGYYPKPYPSMAEMNGDMGGAATVLGLMEGLARTNTPINIDFYFTISENNIDANAFKPGSIYTMGNNASGKPYSPFVVVHPDAEGRVAMSTAVVLADMDKDVEYMVDFSTLTGSMANAGGNSYRGGIIANEYEKDGRSTRFIRQFIDAGDETCQRFFHLQPQPEQPARLRKSMFGKDYVANMSDGPGGAFDGYHFLKAFTDKELLHLDIAGSLAKPEQVKYRGTEPVFGQLPVAASIKAFQQYAATTR